MKVKFNDLASQWSLVKEDCMRDFDDLFSRSNFILGDYVKKFEESFASFIGCKYAIGVSNGTDALKLSAQALQLSGKSLFLIPANTYVATLMGIEQAYPDADYKLIDCDEFHQMDVKLLETKLSEEARFYDNIVIVPVHLYGYTVNMDEVLRIADHYSCIVLEDSSQAHGATWKDGKAGSYGMASAFSLYPGKNLGAAGDAGIITTDDKDIYNRLVKLRNLGSSKKYIHEVRGGNHRLDTLQAIILNHKLPFLYSWNEARRQIVFKYESLIKNPLVSLPKTPPHCSPVHHVYPVLVKDRDKFMKHLNKNDIETGIHYPIIISEMPMYRDLPYRSDAIAYTYSKQMVSLPIHPFMSDEEINHVCSVINSYKK
jgi:dTDP-4-amino-4,6-dideoxygalactose transaminase